MSLKPAPPGLEPPRQLDLGLKAYQTILRVLKKDKNTHTGGCKAFYTPQEWKDRGEQPINNAILIVVHDGGCLAPYFNYDYEAYKCIERMQAALKTVGLFAEAQTSWFTGIFAI